MPDWSRRRETAGLRRVAFAVLVCAGLVPLGACSRTSDGTVVLKKPPAVSSLLPSWARWKPRRAEPAPVFASQFPPVPERQASTPRVRTAKERPKTGPVRLGPKANLACLDRSKPGERVRVVCQ